MWEHCSSVKCWTPDKEIAGGGGGGYCVLELDSLSVGESFWILPEFMILRLIFHTTEIASLINLQIF